MGFVSRPVLNLQEYGKNEYVKSKDGGGLWKSKVVREGATPPEAIIAIIINTRESFEVWSDGFTDSSTGSYLRDIALGFIQGVKEDITDILNKSGVSQEKIQEIASFLLSCESVAKELSPEEIKKEMDRLKDISEKAIMEVRGAYNLPEVNTEEIYENITSSDDVKFQEARMFLSQYSAEQQSRIISLVANHPFLRNYIDRPEIVFKPLKDIKAKEEWYKKPIAESNEPLVALNGYENGEYIQLHERIFPKPEYFDQGIEHALPIVYSREGVVNSLLEYIKLLPEGYGIRAYDGYRPIAVQQSIYDKFYAECKAENPNFSEEELVNEVKKFVSVPSRDPSRPSTHNAGGAIDFRICDMRGNELNYGCGFDDFRAIANLDFFEKRFSEGGEWRENELEALLIKRVTANLAVHEGIDLCCYAEEDWHFNLNDQWDLNVPESQYGSCEANGIIPNPNYTVLDVMAKKSQLLQDEKGVVGGEIKTDKFGYRVTRTVEEIERDKQTNSTLLTKETSEMPHEEYT